MDNKISNAIDKIEVLKAHLDRSNMPKYKIQEWKEALNILTDAIKNSEK